MAIPQDPEAAAEEQIEAGVQKELEGKSLKRVLRVATEYNSALLLNITLPTSSPCKVRHVEFMKPMKRRRLDF